MVLKIESFDRQKHDRSSFDCGNESLNLYIHKQASQDLKKYIASVFVLVDAPDDQSKNYILAYYTLSAYTVEVTDLDDNFAKNLPRYPQLPATLLGRLAVDLRYRGQGFGELMLVDALQKSLDVSQQVASLAVIAEALDESAVSFYLKYGFQRFKQHSMKLYLPMKSIALLYDLPHAYS